MSTRAWDESNQQYLVEAIREMRARLERAQPAEALAAQGRLRKRMSPPPALEFACAAFGLSSFERAILVCAAGVELDASFGAVCAAAQSDRGLAHMTFGLALAAMPDAHWTAVTPAGPLRRWRMIELGPGPSLVTSPIRIDERMLNFLVGVDHVDDRLASMWQPVRFGGVLAPSHSALADRVARVLSASRHTRTSIQLHGADPVTRREVAAVACSRLGLGLIAIAARTVPTVPAELETASRLWDREMRLSGSALIVEHDPSDAPEAGWAADRLVESVSVSAYVSTRDRRPGLRGPTTDFLVNRPTMAEQADLWAKALGPRVVNLDGHVDQLVSQFDMTAEAIRSVGTEVLAGELAQGRPRVDLGQDLWDASRHYARPALEDLAQRIEPSAEWARLILPEPQMATLRDISAHVRRRAIVYERWGFASRSSRGLGISALFAGPSGTGKTMAAEVLARDMRLDLYRIDLSQVVSKYIGETEKNLRRLFDAAEQGGSVLLFDEADALFGKRTEVKDSHDRFANIEVSYLLQRMEAYRGLAILTSNFKTALDPAFLRRIRFVVHFPFPDAEHREAIWRTIFPSQTPTEGLRHEWLARLNVTGGNIRNIALNAAFLAADSGEPVRMTHVMRAARGEYQKLDRPLTDAETAGWDS